MRMDQIPSSSSIPYLLMCHVETEPRVHTISCLSMRFIGSSNQSFDILMIDETTENKTILSFIDRAPPQNFHFSILPLRLSVIFDLVNEYHLQELEERSELIPSGLNNVQNVYCSHKMDYFTVRIF